MKAKPKINFLSLVVAIAVLANQNVSFAQDGTKNKELKSYEITEKYERIERERREREAEREKQKPSDLEFADYKKFDKSKSKFRDLPDVKIPYYDFSTYNQYK